MQPTVAGQRNSAHPWITAEIISDFLALGENREDLGGMHSQQHPLLCVCSSALQRDTPCQRGIPRTSSGLPETRYRGYQGPALLAGSGGAIAHDRDTHPSEDWI